MEPVESLLKMIWLILWTLCILENTVTDRENLSQNIYSKELLFLKLWKI